MAGLGNQMFQYALYRSFLEMGYDAFMDVSSYEISPVHNNYELNHIFSVNERFASNKQVAKVRRFISEMGPLQRLNRKFRLTLGLPWKHITEKEFFQFKSEIFHLKGSYYLDGYWQNEGYFEGIEKTIRREFKFIPPLDERNNAISEKIRSTNSVSVHIRRGDYINNPLYNGICTEDYYQNAIQIINGKLNNPSFFIFSDDIQWCKSNFNLSNFQFVEGNEDVNSYIDMQLMSLCKHNIIANSSFGWWAAWLNNNPEKIVIAPEKWMNGNFCSKDAVPESWIKIHG